MQREGSLNEGPLHGWINCWKPAGVTSHHVVYQVRKLLTVNGKRPKVGHAGTLDPFAEGILPLAIGEATKTVSYQMDASKEYEFLLRWGESRDSGDCEGVVIATSSVRPDKETVAKALQTFMGGYKQTPPMYSAIKINGKRACDRVRAGESVDIAGRNRFVRIDDLCFVNWENKEGQSFQVLLRVSCGKGTYVRALGADIAEAVGALGYVESLTRTRVGRFAKKNAISLGKLEEVRHNVVHTSAWVSVRESLDDIPALCLTPTDAEHLRCGIRVKILDLPVTQTFLGIDTDGAPVGILEKCDGGVRPKRMFNKHAE
ncbi:MAG: tRNA pseudouridine(55) synthase TruB [Alphaproteobacteria bacterium]|nr:MAG: tRNA pseudouridine(55) synthase TruB [Alphaproteobacteria bacterium]